MTKAEKLRRRILASPTPSDISNAELKAFLTSLGFEEITLGKTSGSRIKFANAKDKSQQIRLHISHGASPVDKGALKDVISRLRHMGFIGMTSDDKK